MALISGGQDWSCVVGRCGKWIQVRLRFSFWVAGEGLREEEKMRQTGFVANQEPQLPLPGQSGLRRQPRDSGSRHRSSLGLPPPPQAPGRVGQAAG